MAQDDNKTDTNDAPVEDTANTLEGEWRESPMDDGDITLPEIDKQPKRRRFGAFLLVILAIALLGGLAAAGYFGWNASQQFLSDQADSRDNHAQLVEQIQALESSLAQLKQAQSSATTANNVENQQLQSQVKAQATQQQQQHDAIAAIQTTLAEWSARSGVEQTGWQLAEAEWLLWLANMRLQLQDQYSGALTALGQADRLLQQIDHPKLRPIRSQLTAEVLSLKTAERPDIDNIALSLLAISNQAEQLPLPARPKPHGDEVKTSSTTSPEPTGWRGALAGLWEEMKGLVVIRRQEKNLRPWLSDREEQLIYQGLQVRLDAARLAALRGKGTLYQQSIRAAQTWLLTWFDTGSSTVEAVDSELDALAKQHLDHQAPDISSSLTMLRQLRQEGL
jgi:uroporphyrin-3 C-methyltransferase